MIKVNQVAIDICFEDATRCSLEKLCEYMEMISKFPIRTVTFADTVGCSTPFEYGNIFKEFVKKYPNITFLLIVIMILDWLLPTHLLLF